MIQSTGRTVIYENPLPHVRSRHGYFPGLAMLPNGEIVCLFALGEAFESANSRTWVTRSFDAGETWTVEAPVCGGASNDYLKPTTLADGSLLAIGYRFHREDPEVGIAIPETGGIVGGDDIVTRSADGGRTWETPRVIKRPCPELIELSGPAVELKGGDLIAIGALYKTPDGSSPSGQIGVSLRSTDGGVSWADGGRYFTTPGANVAPYESRLCEMQAGRLVALSWAYDTGRDEHLPNHVTVSHDEGRTWSSPLNTYTWGQASNLAWLGGDRLLTIHAHRGEDPGLFVRIVDFAGDRWRVLEETAIYGTAVAQTRAGQSMPEMFKSLRFGQPSLLQTGDDEFLAVHWCIEDGQGRIRAHRLRAQ